MIGDMQCSHCFRIYNFEESRRLERVKAVDADTDPIKQHGFVSVCQCGKVFFKDTWRMKTELDGYRVSTVHLVMAHQSNVGFTDEAEYWYETMIFDEKGKGLSFQVRYKTREEAIAGHEFTVKNIHRILEQPDKYPQDILAVFRQMIGGTPEK